MKKEKKSKYMTAVCNGDSPLWLWKRCFKHGIRKVSIVDNELYIEINQTVEDFHKNVKDSEPVITGNF